MSGREAEAASAPAVAVGWAERREDEVARPEGGHLVSWWRCGPRQGITRWTGFPISCVFHVVRSNAELDPLPTT